MPATVVLVHGAWHGAWAWERVVQVLGELGIAGVAPDLPGHGDSELALTDLRGDAAFVRDVVDGIDGPIVLCGHSYGGAVVTEASAGVDAVAHLVFVAAVVPEEGESHGAILERHGNDTEIMGHVRPDGEGTATLDREGVLSSLFHDVEPDVAARAAARLDAHRLAALQQPVTAAGWRERPASYVMCSADRALALPIQRLLADRTGERFELRSGHSPFLSMPARLAGILAAVARRY
jgi:pimeloyl-ACP methyl ester carboxylesterase